MAVSALIANLSGSSVTNVSVSLSSGTVDTAPASTIVDLASTFFTVTPGSPTAQYTISYTVGGINKQFIGPLPPAPPNIHYLMWVDKDGHLHYYEQLT